MSATSDDGRPGVEAATFSAPRQARQLLFDRQQQLFYTEANGVRAYYIAPQMKNGILTGQVSGFTLYFASNKRKAGEIFRVTVGREGIIKIAESVNQVALVFEKKAEASKANEIIVGGNDVSVVKKRALGIVPQVKVYLDKTFGKLCFCFGSNRPVGLNAALVKAHGLTAGAMLEVEQFGEKVSAVISKLGKRRIRTPFVLNWLGDPNCLQEGKMFELDRTTSAEVYSDHMTGYRVLEQAWSAQRDGSIQLLVGNRQKKITSRLPWPVEKMGYFGFYYRQ